MQLPNADNRSSILCTTTSSGRLFRMCIISRQSQQDEAFVQVLLKSLSEVSEFYVYVQHAGFEKSGIWTYSARVLIARSSRLKYSIILELAHICIQISKKSIIHGHCCLHWLHYKPQQLLSSLGREITHCYLDWVRKPQTWTTHMHLDNFKPLTWHSISMQIQSNAKHEFIRMLDKNTGSLLRRSEIHQQ